MQVQFPHRYFKNSVLSTLKTESKLMNKLLSLELSSFKYDLSGSVPEVRGNFKCRCRVHLHF